MANIPKTSAQLLAALADDSLSARWTEFANLYVPVMRDYCAATFPDLDADDLIQETLIALVSAMRHYRYDPEAKGYFHNYLVGILRHKAFAQYEKRKRKNETETNWAKGVPDQAEAEAEQAQDDFRQSAMELALRALLADPAFKDQTKQIFLKVAIEGLPPAEVAAAFGVSRDLVDHIRSRMTAKLRKIVAMLENADGMPDHD